MFQSQFPTDIAIDLKLSSYDVAMNWKRLFLLSTFFILYPNLLEKDAILSV